MSKSLYLEVKVSKRAKKCRKKPQIGLIVRFPKFFLPWLKMSKCVKCKQTSRFFDNNGLDFWYFIDLFRTISRVHQMKRLHS